MHPFLFFFFFFFSPPFETSICEHGERSSGPKWKRIRVIGADAAGCAHNGDKGRRYGPGPNCQLLVITLIPPPPTAPPHPETDTKAKPTEWLTAVQIARDKTQIERKCTPLNRLLDLVVIGRHVSLYAPRVIKCSGSLKTSAPFYWKSRPKIVGKKRRQDGTAARATVTQNRSAGSSFFVWGVRGKQRRRERADWTKYTPRRPFEM